MWLSMAIAINWYIIRLGYIVSNVGAKSWIFQFGDEGSCKVRENLATAGFNKKRFNRHLVTLNEKHFCK